MTEYLLSELLKIKNGRDHKHLEDGEIPVYGSGGIMRYANESLYEEESILLPRKGTLDNIQYANTPFWTVDTIYYTVINKEKANAYYLYQYLKLLDLSNLNSGTGVPSMTFGAYYGIKINLPELEVQKQIAKVLSDLDAKIEVNNKISQELEALAKTIFDYWFVQFDFPDQNGKPYKSFGGRMVYSEELKREIPEGWKVKELKEIADCIMGQSPKGETYNQDGVGMPLLNGPADYENGSLKARTYTTDPKRTCQKDDLVLCIRATIGNLVYSEDEFCLGRGVAAVRTKDEKLSELVYYLLLQEIERFKVHATGSIIRGITKEDLTDSKCLIPSDDYINAFHNQINPIFDKIRINKKENQNLAALRDWLLPMLMNGQVTVSEAKEHLGMVAEDGETYK
ncbi:restriction endonuclease subunit S [Mesoflavibacter profundi]|uniref:Restriction endonuclease subunit S n=1 Tax=Mesoflavibacter profundi TaxID=2708110 RepID=A0ABT4S2V6_9FLAO|nr:restriction endonuclease subunit S [Mesoflavibacter profundi]MDA0178403.1 restriction endonuclease subunit S [Mesoflavibacter profundi]